LNDQLLTQSCRLVELHFVDSWGILLGGDAWIGQAHGSLGVIELAYRLELILHSLQGGKNMQFCYPAPTRRLSRKWFDTNERQRVPEKKIAARLGT
jgi:hypothetical protein